MYLWKTKSLSKDIKNNELSDDEWKKYYLGGSLLLLLSMYLAGLAPRTNYTAMFVELIILLGITIFGISVTFNTNQNNGGNGVNYIARVTALSFPLLIKILVFSLLFGIFLGIIIEVVSLDQAVQEWIMVVFALLIQAVFFWRINIHLFAINT